MRIDVSKIKLQLKVVNNKQRKNKVEPKEIPPKKLTKLVNGVVKFINGVYYCYVNYYEFSERMYGSTDIKEITHIPKSITIPFTKESYDCKYYKTVFIKRKQQYGYVAIVRTETQCIFGHYSNDLFIPFVVKWIVRGWIVLINGELQFKFRNLVTVEGHNYRYKGLLDDDEFEWFKDNMKDKK